MARPGLIDALGRRVHYIDHLAPTWHALPAEARGSFLVPAGPEGKVAAAHARALGITADILPNTKTDRLTIVAAVIDHGDAVSRGRPIAYLNHGVGQAWRDKHGRLIPSGVGKPKRDVRAFLAPGPFAARITREVHPNATVHEVGSPKLDGWLAHRPRAGPPVIVVSTHWDHALTPESRSAFPHYLPAIIALAKRQDVLVMGHAHPRAANSVRPRLATAGIPFLTTFDQVLEQASVYITDSSSTLFEFAATGRPVVVLNAPAYRREHHHGLRFWEAASVGVNVDHPSELQAAVLEALEDAPERQAARAAALAIAYAPLDGRATERAVTALLETLEEQEAA